MNCRWQIWRSNLYMRENHKICKTEKKITVIHTSGSCPARLNNCVYWSLFKVARKVKVRYDLNYIWFIFVHFFISFPLPHFVQILPLLVNGKHIKNGGQACGFSCNYFYEDCPLAEGIHYTGDEWKSSTRVSMFNTFDVWNMSSLSF